MRRGGVPEGVRGGRGDRTRTCNRWFWRPVLYQLSYTPPHVNRLLGLPVQLMLPAARAELVQLQAPRVVPLVLPRAVRALLADSARQGDHGSVLGLGHGSVFPCLPPAAATLKQGLGTGGTRGIVLQRRTDRQRTQASSCHARPHERLTRPMHSLSQTLTPFALAGSRARSPAHPSVGRPSRRLRHSLTTPTRAYDQTAWRPRLGATAGELRDRRRAR